MDAFHPFLECMLYLSICVRARAVCNRALAGTGVTTHLEQCWKTTEVGAGFQVKQARVLTRRGLTDSSRLGKN